MENSSNTDMKEVFEHLAQIKLAEPSPKLYAQTLQKIQLQNIVPMIWVRAAAAVLLAFICTEFYLASANNVPNESEISEAIYKTNNILYHE